MTFINELILKERSQYLIFLSTSLAIAGFTAVLYFAERRIFQKYFGSLNPLLALGLTILLGLTFISFLMTRGFSVYKKENQVGLLLATGLAVLFGIVIILVDLKTPFPEDTNVAFPHSLLFYPIMGFVVDVIFHLVLLGGLLLLLSPAFRDSDQNKFIWICILIGALVEPIYQTILGAKRPYLLCKIRPFLFHHFHVCRKTRTQFSWVILRKASSS